MKNIWRLWLWGNSLSTTEISAEFCSRIQTQNPVCPFLLLLLINPIADKPDEAMNFSQAGGSLRLESARIWWASMSFSECINYMDFVDR